MGRIRGDREDVFSHGFICPKGSTLKQFHEDPDRLRTPMVRRDGALEPASWNDAFAEIERRLLPIIEEHGRDAVAVYFGNPSAHSLAGNLYNRHIIRALGTKNVYSASTVDQRPKEITNALLYGGMLTYAVPDLDRTDYVMLLGANPYESNGSLATAPDWPGRLEAIQARGGKVVVVDPRRTKTAQMADEHHPIVPGTDAHLLMGIVHTLFDEGLVDLGAAAPYVSGVEQIEVVAKAFPPEDVAPVCGIDADTIRRLAREIAAAPAAAVYARIGASTVEFGTISCWLPDVINALTGNLDRPGGAMFSKAAAGSANTRGAGPVGRGTRLGRHTSRVRGLPESFGELPVVCLAEEIETPGTGQIRALVTVAGNPVLSTPNGTRLDAALAGLDFMVSLDCYVNETTRHADVILPPPSPLAKSHYDLGFWQFSLRNVANWSPPVLRLEPGQLQEWEVAARLALVLMGQGAGADPLTLDDTVIDGMVRHAVADEHANVYGRDPDELLEALAPRTGPERAVDFMLRTGPYGDGFGAPGLEDGLSLDKLLAHPHGIDLGPLEPRLPEVLRTPSGTVELGHEVLIADVDRLRASLDRRRNGGLVLVGRRHLRSNNSWMHNINVLVKGRPQFTLQINPADAERIGLADGATAVVSSRTGSIEAPVEVTDTVMPGVVSLPHGWGHGRAGTQMAVAAAHAGASSNDLADEELFDPLSGNAVLNGIPVDVTPA